MIDVAEASHAVVDLEQTPIDAAAFIRLIDREPKILYFQPKTQKTYRIVVGSFLRWLGGPPAAAMRESIREWLELLVDGGASSSWVEEGKGRKDRLAVLPQSFAATLLQFTKSATPEAFLFPPYLR